MFFEPVTKGPSQFHDVLLFTICLDAFAPVDYPNVLNSGVFIFGTTNSLQMVLHIFGTIFSFTTLFYNIGATYGKYVCW